MDANQKDFLTEIMNIGLGHASNVLSEISGARASLTVPHVTVCPARDIPAQFTAFGSADVLTVTQSFSGILSGDALLVLSPFSGRVLAYSLFKEMLAPDMSDSHLELASTELGNIVINYFVGSWSEMLRDRFHFGIPAYRRGSLETILAPKTTSRAAAENELYAVCADAHLDIPEFFVAASIITLFDKTSLERLVGSLTPAGQP